MKKWPHLIVDASVIVKWLNQDRERSTCEAFDILRMAALGTIVLSTSDLAVHEVINALIRGKQLRGRALEEAIESFFMLPLTIITTNTNLTATAAIIAQEHIITFYDAIYLALAFEHGVPLITANPKHQKPLPTIDVIPLSEWQGN